MQATNLEGVQKTLLLPLWGRAVETRKPKPILVDEAAVRIIDQIGYDFSTIAGRMSIISQMAWAVRCLHADRTLRAFLTHCPDATVVNLGCGLDTTFERVDNGRLRWFDLDLADVIALRRKFFTESDRRRFLSCSLLDPDWLRHLDTSGPLFLMALGVLYYLPEEGLRAFVKSVADHATSAELMFDACSAFGRKTANRRVIRDGGMDESAMLIWSIEDAVETERWDPRVKLLEAYPLFQGMKQGRTLQEKWGMFLSDKLRVMSMVHLQIGAQA